jgi:hypothetical protein
MKLDTPRARLLICFSRSRPAGACLLAVALFTSTVHVGCRDQSVKEPVLPEQAAEERRAAVQRAEEIRRADLGDPAGVELVASALESTDPLISGTSVSMLMQAAPKRVLQVLASRKRDEGSVPTAARLLLSWLLAHREDEGEAGAESWPVCRWSETTELPGVRSLAAAACAERRVRAGDSLDELMDDPHWVVRCRVVTALAAAAETKPQLRAWLARRGSQDPHPTVRLAARQALAGRSGTANGQIHDRAEPQQP